MMSEFNKGAITQMLSDQEKIMRFLASVPYDDIAYIMGLNLHTSLFLICKGIESLVDEVNNNA